MIVTIGAIKGGVGKSVITTNLAVLRSQDGKNTLLCDADDQETSSGWAEHRVGLGHATPWTTVQLRGTSVRNELLKMKEHYDSIFIDCGGRDTVGLRSALSVSDILVIPFRPSSFDLWSISQISEIVEEAKSINPTLRAFSFINCAGSRGKDNNDSQQLLKKSTGIELIPVTIGMRKSFSHATAEGLAVSELKPRDKKAIEEMKTLYRHIFDIK